MLGVARHFSPVIAAFAALSLLLVAATPAHAHTYCVSNPACVLDGGIDEGTGIATAMHDASLDTTGVQRGIIMLGDTLAMPLVSNGAELTETGTTPIQIYGVGVDKSIISAAGPFLGIMELHNPGFVLSGIGFHLGAASPTGLRLHAAGIASNISVTGQESVASGNPTLIEVSGNGSADTDYVTLVHVHGTWGTSGCPGASHDATGIHISTTPGHAAFAYLSHSDITACRPIWATSDEAGLSAHFFIFTSDLHAPAQAANVVRATTTNGGETDVRCINTLLHTSGAPPSSGSSVIFASSLQTGSSTGVEERASTIINDSDTPATPGAHNSMVMAYALNNGQALTSFSHGIAAITNAPQFLNVLEETGGTSFATASNSDLVGDADGSLDLDQSSVVTPGRMAHTNVIGTVIPFVDAAHGLYIPVAGSAGIDYSDNSDIGLPSDDLASHLRSVRVHSAPPVAWADLGAYEYQYAAPVATATASVTTSEAQRRLTFHASGTDTDPGEQAHLVFTWKFSDGQAATGAVVKVTPRKSGTFTATVTATDLGGRTATAKTAVKVLPLAPTAKLPRFFRTKLATLLARHGVPLTVKLGGAARVSYTLRIASTTTVNHQSVTKYYVLGLTHGRTHRSGTLHSTLTLTKSGVKALRRVLAQHGAHRAYSLTVVVTGSNKGTRTVTVPVRVS